MNTDNEKQYAERDLIGLDAKGNHYCRHVMAMTSESLHSKSDIAAELGYRDLMISELKARLVESQCEFRSADITMQNLEAKCAALAAENAGLKGALEYVINPDNQPEYHDQGMGCGVEDRSYQRDGYSACAYGWESAMDRIYSEVIPDAIPETPATDAFLAEVRAQAQSEVIEWLDAEITAIDTMYRCDPSYEHDAYWMKSNVLDVVELARKAFADQLRKGVQS